MLRKDRSYLWILAAVVWLGIYQPLQSQNFNRPVPEHFPPYEFAQLDTSFSGYYFFCPHPWGNWTSAANMAIADQEGYLAWWAEGYPTLADFKWVPTQHQYTFIARNANGIYHFYDLDTSFALVDSITAVSPAFSDSHEFLTTINGNRLILVSQDTVMNLSNYSFNGNQGLVNQRVKGMGIQEFDPMGNLIWEWRSIDHIHPSEFIDGYYYNPIRFDYAHANTIDQDADGHLLISFRHLNAVYKIHHTTGNVIWRLGGKSSDFSFPNDSLGFAGQHTARKLPNGQYGLFDNGNLKPAPQHSRIAEYELDTVNWTATLAYSYDAGQSIYSPATGSYQNDQSRFRCIGWGNVRRPAPTATLMDTSGQLLSEFYFKDTIVTYRFFAYDLPFELDRPLISCSSIGSTVTLSAPNGHGRYLWSNGATSQHITVSDTGTYQVWVEKGIGMMGSHPFYLSGPGIECGTVALEPGVTEDEDQVLGYYSLMGQRLSTPPIGKPFVIQYLSGRSQVNMIFQGP